MIRVLQAAAAVHVGVDNLNVVGHVDRLIQGLAPLKPFELLCNGDVLHVVKTVLVKRRLGLTQVTKMKVMPLVSGQVRTRLLMMRQTVRLIWLPRGFW